MDADALLRLLRQKCQDEGSTYRFAKSHSISEQYVHNVLKGQCKPGPKIAMALGLKIVRSYEPIK